MKVRTNKTKQYATLLLATGVTVMAGCVSNKEQHAQMEMEQATEQAADASVQASSSSSYGSTSSAQTYAGADEQLLPPNANPGECYARVWAPETYNTISEQVEDKPEQTIVKMIPAQYEYVDEQVMTREASVRKTHVPAEYRTVQERICSSEAESYWAIDNNLRAPRAGNELVSFARDHGAEVDSATVNMCYHEHYIPAQYSTSQEQVLVSEAQEKIRIIPARYEFVEEKVLIQAASHKVVSKPAVYKTVSEKVVDVPAHTIWKKGSGPIQKIDDITGEIMCLVEVPTTYKSITRQELVTPASQDTIEIPAKYKTVKVERMVTEAREEVDTIPAKYETITHKQTDGETQLVWHEIHQHGEPTETRTGRKICLVEKPEQCRNVTKSVVSVPASVKSVDIPAKYETVQVKRESVPAQEDVSIVPATFKTITRKELITEGNMQWRSILCDTNMTRDRICSIQTALRDRGYNPGSIDGRIGSLMMRAVNNYQSDNGLPVDKYLNIETVNSLGVSGVGDQSSSHSTECQSMVSTTQLGSNSGSSREITVDDLDGDFVLDGVNFASDSYDLNAKARSVLDGVAKLLVQNPDVKVIMTGHTDNRGSAEYNKQLSQNRMDSVKAYLVEQGVNADNLDAEGHGEDDPLVSNDSNANMAMNRRVEITRKP